MCVKYRITDFLLFLLFCALNQKIFRLFFHQISGKSNTEKKKWMRWLEKFFFINYREGIVKRDSAVSSLSSGDLNSITNVHQTHFCYQHLFKQITTRWRAFFFSAREHNYDTFSSHLTYPISTSDIRSDAMCVKEVVVMLELRYERRGEK